MLELKKISVTLSGRKIVQDVTSKAVPGELIALVGPNGSGKSTLLKAIAGLVACDGTTNLSMSRKDRARAVSYLAQNASAPDLRTVRDIVALGRTPHIGALAGRSDKDEAVIAKSLSACGITPFADRGFGTLSGGEQMRVHLARTLATQARLLLADEPVTALDPYYQLAAMDVLRAYTSEARIVIVALHDLDLARRYADRVWVMQGGRLVEDNPPETALRTNILADVFRIRETPDGFQALT